MTNGMGLEYLQAISLLELVSVESGQELCERLCLSVPPLVLAKKNDHINLPVFRFLDAQEMGSKSESIAFAIFAAPEANQYKSLMMNIWRACVSQYQFTQERVSRTHSYMCELEVVGCLGGLGRLICMSELSDWPPLAVIETELLAAGAFEPDDIELYWKDSSAMLDWYVDDIPANTGSDWRYVDDQFRQFRIDKVY
jgi:hypothetical protein